ncbi:MAG TPA: alpha/beta hydrolase [Terriglobia bacterium]|nr:alpha/beta hydrolase [Terriglobia bacterium]
MRTLEIHSKDGVLLSCLRAGTGSPLVLVHGTGASASRWGPVLPAFENRFDIYALDRRGRGNSGDSPDYSIERECNDIASVLSSVGQPASLLGHSYGGICALEAALTTPDVRALVLYEPPMPVGHAPVYPAGFIERMESLVADGKREDVVKMFALDVLRMPRADFEAARISPGWPDRLAAAHTLPREMRALENYRFDAERFSELRVPTLLLLGGESPDFFKAGIDLLSRTLPNSHVVILPGQRHAAITTAPGLFAAKVIAFLASL